MQSRSADISSQSKSPTGPIGSELKAIGLIERFPGITIILQPPYLLGLQTPHSGIINHRHCHHTSSNEKTFLLSVSFLKIAHLVHTLPTGRSSSVVRISDVGQIWPAYVTGRQTRLFDAGQQRGFFFLLPSYSSMKSRRSMNCKVYSSIGSFPTVLSTTRAPLSRRPVTAPWHSFMLFRGDECRSDQQPIPTALK
jgi:hypothetical protein